MPPTQETCCKLLQKQIESAAILIFSESTCTNSSKLKLLLNNLKISYTIIELDEKENGQEIKKSLLDITGMKTLPQVFNRGKFIGGVIEVNQLADRNALIETFNKMEYNYDLVVIGGGSGGLSLCKESARLGAKVALLDFVQPTSHGTSWGLGGTCVNVGCIPKKLMHQAALLNHSLKDAQAFGWNVADDLKHNWTKMVEAIQNHIGSLNWGYKVQLRELGVVYLNAYGQLIDQHTVKTTNKKGEVKIITAKTIILATGERPRYPEIPGAREYGITSDDLFSLAYCPNKTLLIGASYVSLECAGFLQSIGLDTTVMVRSILLRGFDQEMAEMIGSYMEDNGTNFIRPCIPLSITEIRPHDYDHNEPGLYEVVGKYNDGTEYKDLFNTVIFAIGRNPCTSNLNLEGVGVEIDKDGRVICDAEERTSIANIFAIGDVANNRHQLAPLAIQAGKNLARRLFAADHILTDYTNIAVTVYTPLEYGSIGYSEEDAIAAFGKSIIIYHSHLMPLEWTVSHRKENTCYMKLICNKADDNRVIGLHVFAPNAGEITQGYAVALKLSARKIDFDRTIGIHPTCSETFTTLTVVKGSGVSSKVTGC